MSNRTRLLIKNACYHLITRGNQRQDIFGDAKDHICYLRLLRKFKLKYKLKIYAYCLMPNHVHILCEIENPFFISNFMHDLNRTYTLCFNKKHKKVGHLWQGRFKSMVIAKDEYLLDCLTYIEFNPVRSGLTDSPFVYPWGSYNARVLGKNDRILDPLLQVNTQVQD